MQKTDEDSLGNLLLCVSDPDAQNIIQY